ncbi:MULTISPECIES: nucleotidyl transferase AbiEii/AbiGii toxin family protein [Bacteroides]|uniref:nucleotidyl transferase AbiEii/AbiGii toxin family protein n=1 Tax=Bacteroides TaxID=816 RepID=UPI00189E2577|nr:MULTISPECIES: nucleotidyl transferase AbiEii/AbiGii toxin family protein [Bacteroides]MDC1767487.1 nucleotidyl transferase AbiEii/AbiGii toxin family protein [Bacteroides uniformis]MDC1771111.1 nucleotidyl transferase AbiEii/AbiGii toxin family protein [Bacteroides uniformis]MDC1777349.1 nucleotidyl transferase AbiEii/AbiGii toxin family protein [Bacteroides uniformis]MDC1778752.1 nucleotidyl transferase AbiEii/AbiGii toxin family protein [Bacteroides uniformis]
MDLKITSEKIANPLLVELLRKLTDSFNRMGREFYVIGATARDIIIRQLIGTTSGRKTKDLDIAIAIPDWSVFEEVKECLIADGFKKSTHMHQRFYYGEYELDVVPYGVAKEDDNIYWPPEEEIAISVKGFDEVLAEAITVNIDDEFSIKIASLHGLFLLKFNAWLDRNIKTSKDAEDMSFILSNYFIANLDRNVYTEVYDWERFDEYIVGGYWLANDLLLILTKEQIAYYKDCIEKELEKEDESRLFNQIMEHSYGLDYDTVKTAWQIIADVFQKALDDENN